MSDEDSHTAESPDRARLIVLAVIGMGLLLGGSRAQCSLMTGDDEDEDEDEDEHAEDDDGSDP
jgi:hypothetical protein